MKCPVCKAECPIQDSADEVYYDCLSCESSLLFNKGECVVLSAGFPQQKTEPPLEEIPTEDNPDQAESETKILYEKQEEVPTNYVQQENPSKEDLEIESGFTQGTIYKGPSLEGQDESSSVEDSSLEEEVFEEMSSSDEQSTQVPELTQPKEEEYLQGADEQKEVDSEQEENEEEQAEEEIMEEEASSTGNLSDSGAEQEASQLGEDFAFEEEPVDEEQGAEPEVEEPPPSQKEDFTEVADFGNTQDEDRQGPFLYDLILSEINSLPVRKKVLSILEDESLNLPLNEDNVPLKDRIKDGKITISKISPVQAYVIVTFLMGSPLSISWSQSHIAESSS